MKEIWFVGLFAVGPFHARQSLTYIPQMISLPAHKFLLSAPIFTATLRLHLSKLLKPPESFFTSYYSHSAGNSLMQHHVGFYSTLHLYKLYEPSLTGKKVAIPHFQTSTHHSGTLTMLGVS
jgi:hypothetical protein